MEKLIVGTLGAIGTYLLLGACLTLGGCYATVGTEDAIKAHFDGMNGLIAEGKASPDTVGAYYQTRQHEQAQLTKRGAIPLKCRFVSCPEFK